MKKIAPMNKNKLIIFLVLALIASLVANLNLYISSKEKLKDFSYQQYNKVLSHYENSILATSHFILSQLDSFIANEKMSKEEILVLYTNYEDLKKIQIEYPWFCLL